MSTVDIRTWQSLDLSKRAQQDVFKRQLVQYLQDQFTPGNLVTLLNGANLLNSGALLVNTQALGSQSGAFTFNCQNALISMFSFTQAGAYTITLTNLAIGSLVMIAMTFSGTHTLTLAASTPGGTAYTSIKLDYAVAVAGGGNINMISTGTSFPSAANNIILMHGAAMTGPSLNLLCQ